MLADGHNHDSLVADLNLAGIETTEANFDDQIRATTGLLMKAAGLEGQEFNAENAGKIKTYLSGIEGSRGGLLQYYLNDGLGSGYIGGEISKELDSHGLENFKGHEKGVANLIVNRERIVDNLLSYHETHQQPVSEVVPELRVAAAAPAPTDNPSNFLNVMLGSVMGMVHGLEQVPMIGDYIGPVIQQFIQMIDSVIKMAGGNFSLKEAYNAAASSEIDAAPETAAEYEQDTAPQTPVSETETAQTTSAPQTPETATTPEALPSRDPVRTGIVSALTPVTGLNPATIESLGTLFNYAARDLMPKLEPRAILSEIEREFRSSANDLATTGQPLEQQNPAPTTPLPAQAL